MKEKELKILSEKLKAWKEELIHEATRTVDGMTTEKAQFADPTDRASMETDRNFLLRIRDRERKTGCARYVRGSTSSYAIILAFALHDHCSTTRLSTTHSGSTTSTLSIATASRSPSRAQ